MRKLLTTLAVFIGLLAAAPVAHADFTFGCANYPASWCAPGGTTMTVYDPGSSTYFHEGNWAWWAAWQMKTWANQYVPGCDTVCASMPHVSPTRESSSNPACSGWGANNCIAGWIEYTNYNTYYYCRFHVTYYGTDQLIGGNSYGWDSTYCSYYMP